MQILGHRGARGEAPENTLEGIALALAAGVAGIEVDVHRTADGRLVVIHDDTLERTTNGAGPVSAHDLAALQRLDAGGGARIPTLEEVLELMRGRGHTFVELKGAGCEPALVAIARDLGARDAVTAISFDHRRVQRVRELDAGLAAGCLIVARPVDPVGLARAADAALVSLHLDYLDADLVAACHAGGVAVCAWNCNDPAQVARHAATGVDWLGTDVPRRLLDSPGS